MPYRERRLEQARQHDSCAAALGCLPRTFFATNLVQQNKFVRNKQSAANL